VTTATWETVYNKSKRRHNFMFYSVFLSLASSTLLIGSLGNAFALDSKPFWRARQFIPTLGMLLGFFISSVFLVLSSVFSFFGYFLFLFFFVFFFIISFCF